MSSLLRLTSHGTAGPPELSHEAALVEYLATSPIDPRAARAYGHRKIWMYGFVLSFAVGLPVVIFAIVSLQGLPTWLTQAAIWVTLGLFFIFFYVMIAVLYSKNKIIKYLGMRQIEPGGEELPDDVNLVATRHGRVLEYGISQSGNFWRLRQSAPSFEVEYRDGAFHASPGLPPKVEAILSELPSNRLWQNLKIQSGPEGLRTHRPVRYASYYLHDLWLFEKMLNAMSLRGAEGDETV